MSAGSALVLDCSKLFDPVSFLGGNWKEVERDERAYAMMQVDFSQCQFMTFCREGEDPIKGEEVLRRFKEDHPQMIRHGGNQFLALWEDYLKDGDNSVLEHLRRTQGIIYLDFFGLILQYPDDGQVVLSVYWGGDRWVWFCSWLDYEWDDLDRSSVSPAS